MLAREVLLLRQMANGTDEDEARVERVDQWIVCETGGEGEA